MEHVLGFDRLTGVCRSSNGPLLPPLVLLGSSIFLPTLACKIPDMLSYSVISLTRLFSTTELKDSSGSPVYSGNQVVNAGSNSRYYLYSYLTFNVTYTVPPAASTATSWSLLPRVVELLLPLLVLSLSLLERKCCIGSHCLCH
jgi:hypothetical protein